MEYFSSINHNLHPHEWNLYLVSKREMTLLESLSLSSSLLAGLWTALIGIAIPAALDVIGLWMLAKYG